MLWQVDTTKHWPKSKPKKKPHHPSSMLINNRCVSLSEPTLWFSWIHSLIPQKLCSCLFVLFVCLKRCIYTNINVCFCCQQGHLARQYSCTCSGWTSRCIMLKHPVSFHSLVAFQHGYLKNRQRTWPCSSHIWPTAPTDKGVFHLERVKCLSHKQRLRPWLNLRLVSHLSYLLCRENSRTICFEKAYAHRAWRV